MSVFTNKTMVQGHINRVGVYDGGMYQTLFLRIGIFSYMKDEKPQYESVNAQISCKLDREGKPTSTSSHPKAEMNKQLFEYLNENVAEGMPIKIHGNLKGNDQIYLDGRWKNFKDLTSNEKELYHSIPKNELITRNVTYLYIEEAKVPNKKEYLNKKQQQPDSQMEGLKPSESEQADSVESDDNSPVDNDGVVQAEVIEPESLKREAPAPRKSSYVRFDDIVYEGNFAEVDINDMDLPF